MCGHIGGPIEHKSEKVKGPIIDDVWPFSFLFEAVTKQVIRSGDNFNQVRSGPQSLAKAFRGCIRARSKAGLVPMVNERPLRVCVIATRSNPKPQCGHSSTSYIGCRLLVTSLCAEMRCGLYHRPRLLRSIGRQAPFASQTAASASKLSTLGSIPFPGLQNQIDTLQPNF